MRKFLIFGLIAFATLYVHAQTKAITDTGDEVILFEDGTWKYTNDSVAVKKEIPLNETPFEKGKKSSFLIKSKNVNIGIWLDPKTWSFAKPTENEDAEFQFEKKGDDLYGMFISEKMEIPIETLKNIAIQNAQSAGPDIQVTKEEYRMVNGKKVLFLQMAGTIQGLKITYSGYYYSNAKGTIQLLTYTGTSLYSTYEKDIEVFLNGLVELSEE